MRYTGAPRLPTLLMPKTAPAIPQSAPAVAAPGLSVDQAQVWEHLPSPVWRAARDTHRRGAIPAEHARHLVNGWQASSPTWQAGLRALAQGEAAVVAWAAAVDDHPRGASFGFDVHGIIEADSDFQVTQDFLDFLVTHGYAREFMALLQEGRVTLNATTLYLIDHLMKPFKTSVAALQRQAILRWLTTQFPPE